MPNANETASVTKRHGSIEIQTPLKHSAPKPTGYDADEIGEIAGLVAHRINFSPGDDLTPLVEKLGGECKYLDTEEYYFKGGNARIVVDAPSRFTIYLHKLGGLFSNRFAIAHELGHYFLHSKMGQTPITATHSEKTVSPEEWEATVFAAALLMPKTEVKRLSKRGLTDFDLSAKFSVSPEAVAHWKKMLEI